MTTDITWTGDPEDDCVAKHNGMVAHVEKLNDGEWFASVIKDGTTLFNTADSAGTISTGWCARAVCEAIMKGLSDGE